MKLHVDRIPATPEAHHHVVPAAWWLAWCGGDAGDGRPLEDFQIDLRVRSVGDDVEIEGELQGVVEPECSRCVERYRHALRETFQLVLEPARDRKPTDPEGEEALAKTGLWLGDDLEVGWYRGKEIDLERYLAEVISLSLPAQPLCHEECSGLCPSCGVRRSEQRCDCKQDEALKPKSPFAVLAALKGDSGGEN